LFPSRPPRRQVRLPRRHAPARPQGSQPGRRCTAQSQS